MPENQNRVATHLLSCGGPATGDKIGRIARVFIFLAVRFLLTIEPAATQNRNGGEITGTVTDASGAVIPSARVTIQDTLTGVITGAVTDSHGVYDAASLIPGTYSVSFSMQGFQDAG